jgi:ribonuclease E
MGLILRTAGVGKSVEEIQWDLDYLIHLWQAIEKASQDRPAPFLVYQESDLVTRAIRDYLRNDINEILIDEQSVFEQARDFMAQVMPHNLAKVKHYQDPVPLFSRYQIESQIESAFQREVRLPSGGSLVIDHTEALVSVDINSAKATKGGDIEETALNTNLEAADAIARQMRLRDIGGLIVIDFIDMTPSRNQREVENRLREALKLDRARVQVGRISRFGLLEMSRQRLRPSLGESSQVVCPRCSGQGTIRGVESLGLSVLRIVEEEAMKEKSSRIIAQLPVPVAAFLLNEKRQDIGDIEKRHSVNILLVPNPHFDTPAYEVQRIRSGETTADSRYQSYEVPLISEEVIDTTRVGETTPTEAPAVKKVSPPSPRPAPVGPGLFVRLWRSLFASGKPQPKPKPDTRARGGEQRRGGRQQPRTTGGKPGRGQQQAQARRSGSQGRRTDSRQTKKAAPSSKGAPAKAANAPAEAESPPPTGGGAADTRAQGRPSKEGSGSSRRGRRGGRRRRGGQSQQGATAENQPQANTSPSAASEGSQATDAPAAPNVGRATPEQTTPVTPLRTESRQTGETPPASPPTSAGDVARSPVNPVDTGQAAKPEPVAETTNKPAASAAPVTPPSSASTSSRPGAEATPSAAARPVDSAAPTPSAGSTAPSVPDAPAAKPAPVSSARDAAPTAASQSKPKPASSEQSKTNSEPDNPPRSVDNTPNR